MPNLPIVAPNPFILTPKKKLFAQEYLKDLNGRKAAIRAGYSERSAQPTASRLLNEVAVSQYIDELMGDRSARTAVTADMIVRELAVLSLSDVSFFEFDEDGFVQLREGAPDMAMRAIKSVKRRVRYDRDGNKTIESEIELWDKNSAINKLGKHLGMFTDRHEISGPDGGPIVTKHVWKFGDREIEF